MISVPNSFKLWSGILISLLLTLTPASSKACGGDMYWDIEFYSFFDPALTDLPGYMPFHYTFSLLYDYEWANEDLGQESNLQAWRRYLGNQYPIEEISYLVYSIEEDILASLETNPKKSLNRFQTAISQGKHPEVLHYLIQARKCEIFNNTPAEWNADRPLLPSSSHSLVRSLRQGYQNAPDDQLKMRYAFQLVRLLHYGGYFEETVQAYEQLALPLNQANDGLIGQWTRAQYAGALHGLERLAEASYHFSKVFDQCPSLRPQAWYSYDIPDQVTWEAALALCQNQEEKANLLFMRAISPNAVATEEIRNIQQVFPGSAKIDLLLVREINKLEEKLLGGPEWDFRTSRTPNLLDPIELDLHALVKTTRASGQMHNRQIWDLADAYLEFLGGRPAVALQKLDRIEGDDFPETQSRILNLAIRIAQMRRIDLDKADKISKDFKRLQPFLSDSQLEQLQLYQHEYLSSAYQRAGRPGMALLAAGHIDWLTSEPTLDLVEELLLFSMQKEKSLYEQELFGELSNNFSYHNLVEMKGTLLFAEDRLEAAIEVFKSLPEEYRLESSSFAIGPDPFAAKARDIIDCGPDCIVNKFTKLTLAQTLLKLKEKADNEPQKAGQYCHLLGNAYFTTSYFGACWEAKDYYRSSVLWGGFGENPHENTDVSIALEYYKRSIKASNNREIAALSCLMAAKAFAIEAYYPNIFPTGDQSYQPYYSQLAEEFGNTEVYDMAIDECKYFAFFVGR